MQRNLLQCVVIYEAYNILPFEIYEIYFTKVLVVQMFNEREDYMMKLFGISGRTQASIDYWGECALCSLRFCFC